MRSEAEVAQAIGEYADTVKRICVVYLKNPTDTQDIFQEVFLKYALSSQRFESREHEKAWLIRVTVNQCKDLLKSAFRRKTLPLEEAAQIAAPPETEQKQVLEAVLSLPEKYKIVVYLHYYEGYSGEELGKLLGKSPNTIYTLLSRAKVRLRNILEGQENG